MAMIPLACAMVLDAVFGEPKWLWDRVPHPAVLMGRVVAWLEGRMNRPPAPKASGVITVGLLVGGAIVLGLILSTFGPLVEIIVCAILLAQRSLVQHVGAVADGLATSVREGRAAVAMIVGRDTGGMDEAAVARAAIESAAENFSDGFVAPAFWFAVAGVPGILVYKIVNTADSMIGYRTPRLEQFGWAAARLDDVLNWVPARLTAVVIMAVHGRLDLGAVARDAALHRSPNAGWPEAALAPVLGVALAGPRSYDGTVTAFDWVNPDGRRDAGTADIRAACAALWRVWAACLAGVLVLAVVF